ncbi:carboxymuconolactone decarboxylase family protein [Candidatus Poriferisocius sp.]|uniref:carboxymuconolactone decarboxylase family protein n=1 Tax=Candidatus Poriferisocius sp. TaxID=3101276 RepID=UPI003B0197B3
MTTDQEIADARAKRAAIAPKLSELTADVLFGDIWKRTELSPRERSLITVASVITLQNDEAIHAHLSHALRNGLTIEELGEVITHIAFYAGFPATIPALNSLVELADG